MGQIERVGIVGAGQMGIGIAEVVAKAGIPTVVIKATPGAPDEAVRRIERSLAKAVEKGKLSVEERDATLSRLRFTADRSALGACDLVIESIVEDLETKAQLFRALSEIVGPTAILASNTSTLRVRDIALAAGTTNSTVGMHFFSPAPLMKLVELAYLESTPVDVIDRAAMFLHRIGKTAVPVVDSTGFIVNRLLVPLLVGAIAAYEQGLARPEAIDTAMKLGCGHPVGPLALADLIGLDVVYAMSKLLYADFRDARYKPPSILRRLVQQGHLGKKTGLGLYDYSVDPPRANEDIWRIVRHDGLEVIGLSGGAHAA